MISITTVIPGENNIIINEYKSSILKNAKARVSRVKTLDGNTYVTKRGYTDEDRSLIVKARLTEAKSDTLWDLFKNESLLNVSIRDGFYSGVIESLAVDNGEINMKIFINEKLS